MKISVVTTMFHSADYLLEFYQRLKVTLEKITTDYEFIFVDDGSPDHSSQIIQQLIEKDSHIILIELSRNFGHHKAIMTGLAHATGDYIYLTDCDLEEEPEILLIFWNEMQKPHHHNQIDVIYGVQRHRKGNWFEKISGHIYFFILKFLTSIPIDTNQFISRLITRRFVNQMLRFKEHEIDYTNIEAMTGFTRKAIPLDKKHKGKTTYTLSRKFQLAINSITALSAKPLVYIFFLGIVVTFFSIGMFSYIIIQKLFFGVVTAGWTSIIASIWFLGGLLIFCIGVIGLYISIIFTETKNRPHTIVKNITTRRL